MPNAGHRVQVDVGNLDDEGYELLTQVIALLTDDAYERARRKVMAGEWAIQMDGGEVTWAEPEQVEGAA